MSHSYRSYVSTRRALAAAGLIGVGPPRFARYDPPMKPWFLRRNEVVIDVEDLGWPKAARADPEIPARP